MVGGSNPLEPVFYSSQGMNAQMKGLKDFSLLEHKSVPQHILLSENETAKVLKEYDIVKEQLPKIKSTDPVAVEIGAEVGDVIKVIRESQTAGEGLFFRLVID